MQFDITELDKKLVVQTLFAHADPIGLGNIQYSNLRIRGDNVDGLTDEECENILLEFNNNCEGHFKLLDYHKGKPMKLTFKRTRSGQILVSTDEYDARNGVYKFFEALLDIFSLEEIAITKKGYKQFTFSDQHEHLQRPMEEIKKFKLLLKNTIKVEKDGLTYWVIDETKSHYQSNYMLQ